MLVAGCLVLERDGVILAAVPRDGSGSGGAEDSPSETGGLGR